MTPVFQTSTYAQPAPAEWPWEYSRTHNPTRTALQHCIASLEGGRHGVCFSSGMAAIDTAIRLLPPGSHVLCGDDVYGGTYRLFTKCWQPLGYRFTFVDTTNPDPVIPDDVDMVWVESPTNPLLKVTDIAVHRKGPCRRCQGSGRQHVRHARVPAATRAGRRHRALHHQVHQRAQ